MKNKLTLLFLTLGILQMAAQQNVPPCPMPGSSYSNAPLLDCCLDGYHFSTIPGGGLEVPSSFCGTVESGQWLAFQPSKWVKGMTIGLEVSNCSNGTGTQGVEMQVFGIGNGCGLDFLSPVSTCVEVTTLDSVVMPNLESGHVYYILLDGVQNDICEYTLRVLDIEKCEPPSPHLEGPNTANTGQTITYTLVSPIDTCDYQVHNPCNNIKQDTVTCMSTCSGSGAVDTIWTGPPGSTVVPNPGSMSADVTFGTESGYVRVEIVGPCYSFVDEIYVEVCSIQVPILAPSYHGDCPIMVFVPGDYVSYSWSNGQTANPAVIFSPGNVSVTVTNAQGCTAIAATLAIPFPPLPPFIAGQSLACTGESVILTASSFMQGANYHWAGPSFDQLSPTTISANEPGTYTVTAINACGVSPLGAFEFSWYPPVTTVFSPLQLCPDDLPYDFHGQMITSSGNYSAVLNNWQGCDSIISQSITVLPSMTASVTSSAGTVLPPGGSTTLDAGAGFASYVWQNGETTQTITVDQPGTYSVTVTATSSICLGTASITLTLFTADCPNFNIPIAPSDLCASAPAFCDGSLEGYCSSNDGYTPDVPGNLGSVIPCTIENNQWLQFTTCDTLVQFEFAVNNCLAATGLEFFVLQTADCQIFAAQAACFEIANGSSGTLTVGSLVSGETYYLMVDGIGGDICSWQVLSTNGVSEGAVYQAVNTPGQVESVGDVASYCAGGMGSFYFTPANCSTELLSGCPAYQQLCVPHLDTCIATQYDTVWHVVPAGAYFENNDSIGSTVNIIFPDTLPVLTGGYLEFTVSVEFVPVSVDTSDCWVNCLVECATILPGTEPCAILPQVVRVCKPDNHYEYFTACEGECIDFMGETFCTPGDYTFSQQDECGCTDSYSVTFEWTYFTPPTTSAPTYTCSADGMTYTVSFLVNSLTSYVTVNGQVLNGQMFTSNPIPSGEPYAFTVEGFFPCGVNLSVLVNGSYTCPPCIGDTHDLGTIQLCPGNCFDLLGNSYCNPGDYTELLFNPDSSCHETYVFTLTQIVENQLEVGLVTEFCDATNQYYFVGFGIEGGNPPYFVNGNSVPNGGFYQSEQIPTGQPYAFTVTDAATCSPQEVNIGGLHTCSCLTDPGSAQLATLYGCEGEMASVEFNNDANVGPNDMLVFILHTADDSSLGTIIGMNATGSFGFVPGMMNFGQTYYISPAVGEEMNGAVNVNDPCFQLSPGQPVVFYESPTAQILPTDTLNCVVNSLTVNSLVFGGSSDFAYGWSGPNNFDSDVANPEVSLSGTYALVVTDNLTGCSTQAAVAVPNDIQPPVFTVNAGEINCQQSSDTLEAASQIPGLTYTYTWTLPSGDVMTGTSIFTNIPGDYAIVALGTNGCTADAATFVVDNGVLPSLTVNNGSVNCSQPSVLLTATSNAANATFTWTLPNGTTSTGPSLNTSEVGNYAVSALAPNGCMAEAPTSVVEGPGPELVADIEATPPTCFGDADGSINVLGAIGGTAPYSFKVNGSQVENFLDDLPAGNYLLTVSDANGCTSSITVQLPNPELVMVDAGNDLYIHMGESVALSYLSSIVPDSAFWAGPDGQAWHDISTLNLQPVEGGQFAIVVFDENNCWSSDTMFIYVDDEAQVYLPNAFSPNNDGVNDFMMLYGGPNVREVIELQVFDRWGELVFESYNFQPTDYVHGWDGRHKGKLLDPSVFVVKAELEFLDGTRKTVVGDVTLVR